MKEAHNHIIEKVFVDIDTTNIDWAYLLKDKIDFLLKNELFPQIELLFDEYSPKEEIARIDKLDIKINVDREINFGQIKYDIGKQLENTLQNYIPTNYARNKIESGIEISEFQRISIKENFEDLILLFLSKGYFPWFGNEKYFDEQMTVKNWETNLKNELFTEKVRKLVAENESAVYRFISQFTDEIIFAFVTKINPGIEKYKLNILEFSKNLKSETRQLIWNLFIQVSVSKNNQTIIENLHCLFYNLKKNNEAFYNNKQPTSPDFKFVKIIQKLLPRQIKNGKRYIKLADSVAKNKYSVEVTDSFISEKKTEINSNKKEEISNVKEKQSTFFEEEESEIAVQNAGLILLHPFIKNFFVASGIAEKQGDILPQKLDLAIQSLHFISTGSENVLESNLVFEKFLCGVPLKKPVLRQSLLTDEIKSEAQSMLKEVIKNWPALKSTSPDGLRQMFLQRDGKLIRNENDFKLIVERKAQDILLEKLSWNITIVKLPWVKELIFVEW